MTAEAKRAAMKAAPPAERVRFLVQTLAMLQELAAEVEWRWPAIDDDLQWDAYGAEIEEELGAALDTGRPGWGARATAARRKVDRVGTILENLTSSLAKVRQVELGAADLAEIERRLAEVTR